MKINQISLYEAGESVRVCNIPWCFMTEAAEKVVLRGRVRSANGRGIGMVQVKLEGILLGVRGGLPGIFAALCVYHLQSRTSATGHETVNICEQQPSTPSGRPRVWAPIFLPKFTRNISRPVTDALGRTTKYYFDKGRMGSGLQYCISTSRHQLRGQRSYRSPSRIDPHREYCRIASLTPI